jgi:hypothetical protein
MSTDLLKLHVKFLFEITCLQAMEKELDCRVVFKGDTEAYLHVRPEIIEELDTSNGDTFLLTANGVKRYFPTFRDETLKRNQVAISPWIAASLGLQEGDRVELTLSEALEYGQKVSFELQSSSGVAMDQEQALKLLMPYFEDNFSPVTVGMLLFS